MRVVGACLSLLFALALPGAEAMAQGMCSRPLSPTCATYSGTFSDEAATLRCRTEIQAYRARMAENEACLLRQAKEDLARSDEVVRAFECRADGGKDCDRQGEARPGR